MPRCWERGKRGHPRGRLPRPHHSIYQGEEQQVRVKECLFVCDEVVVVVVVVEVVVVVVVVVMMMKMKLMMMIMVVVVVVEMMTMV